MPFSKKDKNEVKERTLPSALGIDESRSDVIAKEIHELIHELAEEEGERTKLDNSKFLLALYEKYDDKELLYAVYAGTRIIARHEESPVESLLKFLMEN